MNKVGMLKKISAAACLTLFLNVSLSNEETVSCHTQKNGIFYKLELKRSTKVNAISYKSITLDSAESTCEIVVDRNDAPSDSMWKDLDNGEGIVVEVPYAVGKEKVSEVIFLRETSSAYHLRLMNSMSAPVHNMECGMAGLLTAVITLRKGYPLCEFD